MIKSFISLLLLAIYTTLSTVAQVTDLDGNIYNTVTIGTQIWMDRNLKTTKFNDGKTIPLVSEAGEWNELTTPGYCWYGNDPIVYKENFGALYNWFTVNTGKLCPIGWHVPTDTEWSVLTEFLGGKVIAGGKLKDADTVYWLNPNTGATNETGFTALPGGYRFGYDYFYLMGSNGFWWVSTEYTKSSAWSRSMGYNYSNINRYFLNKQNGFSVRCLHD
jgi:uncharacterized protein (TIGR02145 family)